MNELEVPPTAAADPNAVEILRLWVAEGAQWVSINPYLYRNRDFKEEWAWGLFLSDAIKHVANAISELSDKDKQQIIDDIRASFEAEITKPTSDVRAEFSNLIRRMNNGKLLFAIAPVRWVRQLADVTNSLLSDSRQQRNPFRILFLALTVLTAGGCQSVSTCEFSPLARGWTRTTAPERLPDDRNKAEKDWYVSDQGVVMYCPGRFGTCGNYYRIYQPTENGFVLEDEIVCIE